MEARLLGGPRARSRGLLAQAADELMSEDAWGSRVEALAALRRELDCLEKEAVGVTNVERIGSLLGLGLTTARGQKQLRPWVRKLLGSTRVLDVARIEGSRDSREMVDSLVSFKVDESAYRTILVQSHVSNHWSSESEPDEDEEDYDEDEDEVRVSAEWGILTLCGMVSG